MNIQDRQKTLTAEGLRQRYNLDGLDNDRKSIQLIKNSINKVEIEFQNYMDIVNKSLGEYQSQVEITTWFSNDYPTFESPEDHLGDLYYDRENGKAYRFNKTKNLFNKDSANILNAYLSATNITSLNITRLTYLPIEENTTYTISKNGSQRLRVGTTINEPEIGSSLLQEITADGEDTVTITTNENANYLCVYYYLTNDNNEKTEEEVFNSIQVELGTEATEYTPYYVWEEIEIDKQVETLAIENSKADTSDDKRIVFVETPTTPYTIGDVLIKNGTYYRCRAARESGEYSMNDWIIYKDYTEDMVMLDTRAAINQLQTNVETNYVSQTQLETNTQGIYATVSSTYATQTTVSTLDGEVQNTKTDVRNIDTRLSVEEGKVSTLITDVGNRTGKTSSLTQEVDEIKAEISDIADITKSAERYEAYIPDTEFQDIASSTPINVEIHPVGENISYLYPNESLFSATQNYPAKVGLKPSSTLTPSTSLTPSVGYPAQGIKYLKVRALRFTNTSTNEIFDYILPEDLLYYDANVYDIFTADYESRTLQVLKKCKYNADGTVSQLTPVETHTYNFDDFEEALELTQGDYEISILGYTTGYIKVRLMALNAYTAQYATKIELRTSIVQTRDYVDIEASKKVGNNEVIGKINLSPEAATISANKINIQGVLTAINNDTTTTIDGDKITTGSITANQLSSDSVNASKIVAGTITADKIANATITGSKLVNGTITGTQIADSTINNSKIANGTIENAKIKNGTIEGTKIKDATITSAKISSIDASKITTGTLTSREINNGNGTFRVTSNGVLTASSGIVGGWSIGATTISQTHGNYTVTLANYNNDNESSRILHCTDNRTGNDTFYIHRNGKLYANNAEITGSVSSSTISGSTISGGSISINRGDYYFNMGLSTSHPNCSGLNVGSGGVNINGLGLNTTSDTGGLGTLISISSGLTTYRVRTTGGVRTNLIDSRSGNPINILSSGSSGSASGGGILLRTGNGHITLDARNGGGYVYAAGVGVSSSKVLTNSGEASSKNVKTNIELFSNSDYDAALNLLKGIELYSYDYKYKLSNNLHQYGFIIDEIEKQNGYNKFFNFSTEKAKVNGEYLDFDIDSNEKGANIIEVKHYDPDVLDKYLLTCIKALQHKIDELEEKINE